jgi:hypothetical protein
MPTQIRNSPVNSSLIKTRGFDFQIDYNVDLWGGQFNFRHLANYQPTNSDVEYADSRRSTPGRCSRT